jgi:hypothetical protein
MDKNTHAALIELSIRDALHEYRISKLEGKSDQEAFDSLVVKAAVLQGIINGAKSSTLSDGELERLLEKIERVILSRLS